MSCHNNNCGCSPSGYPTVNNECCTDVSAYTRFAYSSAQSAEANAANAKQSAEDAVAALANVVLKTGDTMTGALIVNNTITSNIGIKSTGPMGIGYSFGAGNTVTQSGSRTTAVTINKPCGSIQLVSAAGSASYQTFIVNNTSVESTDTIIVNQKSGTDKYIILVTTVGTGTFSITFATTGGTTTEQPIFNFAILKAVTS